MRPNLFLFPFLSFPFLSFSFLFVAVALSVPTSRHTSGAAPHHHRGHLATVQPSSTDHSEDTPPQDPQHRPHRASDTEQATPTATPSAASGEGRQGANSPRLVCLTP